MKEKTIFIKKVQNDDYPRYKFREVSCYSFSSNKAMEAAPFSPIENYLFNEFKFIKNLKD